MKRFISLALCCCCIGTGWADEFKLEFSKDILDSAGGQQADIEAPASSATLKSNAPVLLPVPVPPKTKTEPDSPVSAAPDQKPVSPTERINFRQSAAPSRGNYSRPPAEDFSPLKVPPEKLLGGLGLQSEQADQLGNTAGQNQHNPDVFEQLHDEFKLAVGDDLYTQMAWSYDEVKELDNWLSATFSQLTQIDSESIFVGLNDQIIANFTVPEQIGVPGQHVKSVADRHADALKTPEYAARYGVSQAVIQANFENQSKFLLILNYLTLSNLLYLAISVATVVYIGKFFRFLIKLR